MNDSTRLAQLDHAHVWHPFTPMRQWRDEEPLIIDSANGCWLIDTKGKRYLDGVSSLWCNVHGHHVPEIDAAIRQQLDRVAHSTLLGLSHAPAIELAARLCAITPGHLEQVFYSDAGATATEVAFKMAVGYWFHRGQPNRHVLLSLQGAYHGDTAGAMSVGYSETFHRPFQTLTFQTKTIPAPDPMHGAVARQPCHTPVRTWALEDPAHTNAVRDHALIALEKILKEGGDTLAALVVEPLVQGAAGMVMHPPGYLAGAAKLARQYGVLLIADEVATGFGRTGRLFACEHESVEPDILCLGKGLTGGYLPLAATLCAREIAAAFEGDWHEHRTLYHGHTYTGNPLGCAAAMASLDLLERDPKCEQIQSKAEHLARALNPLRDVQRFNAVTDVRQRGLMVGIELMSSSDSTPNTEQGGDFGETAIPGARRIAHEVCAACRLQGVIIRPLGNVIILMPPLSITPSLIDQLAHTVIQGIESVTTPA